MKKIFSLILAMVMLFSFNSFAFAEGPELSTQVGEDAGTERFVMPDGTRGMTSLSGYASKFVSTSGQGSFTVTVTGSYSWQGGLTFKTSCDESEYAYAVVTIKRPNSGYLLNQDTFTANEEIPFTFYFAATGTYTIDYVVYVPSGATLQMQCWIYNV